MAESSDEGVCDAYSATVEAYQVTHTEALREMRDGSDSALHLWADALEAAIQERDRRIADLEAAIRALGGACPDCDAIMGSHKNQCGEVRS